MSDDERTVISNIEEIVAKINDIRTLLLEGAIDISPYISYEPLESCFITKSEFNVFVNQIMKKLDRIEDKLNTTDTE